MGERGVRFRKRERAYCRAALVVAARDENTSRVGHAQQEDEGEDLDRVRAAVKQVAAKDDGGIAFHAQVIVNVLVYLNRLHFDNEVGEFTVDVAEDGHLGTDGQYDLGGKGDIGGL